MLQSARLSSLQQRVEAALAEGDSFTEADNVVHMKEEKRARHKQQASRRESHALHKRQNTMRIRQSNHSHAHGDALGGSGLARFGQGCSASDLLEFMSLFDALDPQQSGRLTRDSLRASALFAHATAQHGLKPGDHVLARLERALKLDERYYVTFEDCLPHVFPCAKHEDRQRMVAFFEIHRFVGQHIAPLVDSSADDGEPAAHEAMAPAPSVGGTVRFYWAQAKKRINHELRDELEQLFFKCTKERFGTIGFADFLEVLAAHGIVGSTTDFVATLGRRNVLSSTRELEAKEAFEILRVAVLAGAPRSIRSVAKNIITASRSLSTVSKASLPRGLIERDPGDRTHREL